MKANKLIVTVMLATSLSACLFGCGNDDVKVIDGNGASTSAAGESASDGYVFSYKNIDIPVDADFAPILEELGEPNSYFESESCAAQGIGKHYTYNDFEIETYPDGDVDRVLYVMLKSDAVSTKEGINTSSTKDDIIAAYGEPTEEVTGSLIYKTSSMKIKFLFNGDSMISIEYDSPLA